MDEQNTPDWVENLFEALASSIEFKGFSDIAWRYLEPDDTSWEVHLLEIAPAIMDLSEFGAEAGEEGFGIIHNFDILEAQRAFDEVQEVLFGVENERTSCVTIGGKIGDNEIVARIYTEPFEEIDNDDDINEEPENS